MGCSRLKDRPSACRNHFAGAGMVESIRGREAKSSGLPPS
jgi:hypothetical protein